MSMHTAEPDVAEEVAAAVPSTTIVEYSAVLAGLSELRRRYAGLAFDLTTTKGNTEARQARQALVKLRTSLEDKRKEIKAPALARARAIDDDARLIREAIEALEGPIDEQIRVDEARRESERAARIAAEQVRIDAIRRRMLDLFTAPVAKVAAGTASEIADAMAWVERTAADASFEDLQLEAETLKSACLDRLRAMHSAAVLHERQQAERLAEQARVEAEAAERRKAEAAEREAQRQADAAAREERARIEREERAAHEAENARLREENAKLAAEKAERERAEAEARAQQEAVDRAHRETQERIARDEAAERARQREAEQAALDRLRAGAPAMLEALRVLLAFFLQLRYEKEIDPPSAPSHEQIVAIIELLAVTIANATGSTRDTVLAEFSRLRLRTESAA